MHENTILNAYLFVTHLKLTFFMYYIKSAYVLSVNQI